MGSDADLIVWDNTAVRPLSAISHATRADINVYDAMSPCATATCVVYAGHVVVDSNGVRITYLLIYLLTSFSINHSFDCLYIFKEPEVTVMPFDASGCVVECWTCKTGGCRFESRPGLLRTKVYSVFHPSVVGK